MIKRHLRTTRKHLLALIKRATVTYKIHASSPQPSLKKYMTNISRKRCVASTWLEREAVTQKVHVNILNNVIGRKTVTEELHVKIFWLFIKCATVTHKIHVSSPQPSHKKYMTNNLRRPNSKT